MYTTACRWVLNAAVIILDRRWKMDQQKFRNGHASPRIVSLLERSRRLDLYTYRHNTEID